MLNTNNYALHEIVHPVRAIAPASVAASGVSVGQYISLKNIEKLGILIHVGAGTGTFNITLLQASAVAGTGAKALSFTYCWKGLGTGDSLVRTAVAADSLPLVANNIVTIDIDPNQLDVANGFTCVKVVATESGGAAAQLVSAEYMAKSSRYNSDTAAPSELVD